MTTVPLSGVVGVLEGFADEACRKPCRTAGNSHQPVERIVGVRDMQVIKPPLAHRMINAKTPRIQRRGAEAQTVGVGRQCPQFYWFSLRLSVSALTFFRMVNGLEDMQVIRSFAG